jgi:hypothetical protein
MEKPDETARQELELGPGLDPAIARAFEGTLKFANDFQELIAKLKALNAEYLLTDNSYPITAVKVRAFAIMALDVLRKYLPENVLPAVLEVLAVELSEVNAGRNSSLFQPDASDTSKVRLTVRAASAAALHVLVQHGLASVERGAALISKQLFYLSISRVSASGEVFPIPPATIIDWRKHRKANSPEFLGLFARFTDRINRLIADRGGDASSKKQDVIVFLRALIVAFNYK